MVGPAVSPPMRIDLHCHSTCSDGTLAPEAVAAAAGARGVEVFALTDHDTCAGTAVARPAGARVVRATEISCADGTRSVHVLAYDTGGAWHLLEQRLAQVREARRRRLRVMAAKLAQRGIRVEVEPLIASAGDRSIGRPDLARLMVAAGAVTSMKEAFNRYLYDGGPVDVAHRDLPIGDAVELGRAAGARLALAHPHQHGDGAVAILRRWRDHGLDGIEVHYGAYDPAERAKWRKVAAELGLVETAGSDFHEPGDPAHGIDVEPDVAARLCAWLGLA
jgi:predicted metal-dependent phosphoesterase TrpH